MRALHATTLKETAQQSTFWPLLSQVLICVEKSEHRRKSSKMLIQRDPAEPALLRRHGGDGDTQPDAGKVPGSPERPRFMRALGLLSQAPYGREQLGTDLLGISYLHYIA